MQQQPTARAASRYRIGVVDPVERDALSTLRRAAYRKAPEFDWIDEAALRWSIADDAGVVLALWDDQDAMRGVGYEFVEPRSGWDTEAVARTQPLLALLRRARFASALGAATAAVTVRLDAVQIESAAIAAALRAGCQIDNANGSTAS